MTVLCLIVMGNELEKIERNGIQIAQHPRISPEAGKQLQEEVKVSFENPLCIYVSSSRLCNIHITMLLSLTWSDLLLRRPIQSVSNIKVMPL